MANLYNGWRDESPVVVLATQQVSDARTGTATIGEADQAQVVAPFTRLARGSQRPAEVLAREGGARCRWPAFGTGVSVAT